MFNDQNEDDADYIAPATSAEKKLVWLVLGPLILGVILSVARLLGWWSL